MWSGPTLYIIKGFVCTQDVVCPISVKGEMQKKRETNITNT